MGVVVHTLPPVYDQSSLVLILGTMPSPKSREYGFYYSHPQNRFWRVLSTLFQEPLPQNNAEKEALVRSHHIALWDVLASCEIQGAADASIRRPVANDLRPIFETCLLYTSFCKEALNILRLTGPIFMVARHEINRRDLDRTLNKCSGRLTTLAPPID